MNEKKIIDKSIVATVTKIANYASNNGHLGVD